MTRAEQWHTVIRVVVVIAPMGALVGLIPGYFAGGRSARSIAAGALIGLLVSAGMAGFDSSWGVGLVPRRWREAPFLVVLVTRSLARSSSSDVIDALVLPRDVGAESLGPIELRGIGSSVELIANTRTG